MSKIIEALEKAKREGTLDRVAGIEERETLAPAGAAGAAAPRPKRDYPAPREAGPQSFDANLLCGVDPRVRTLHDPMSLVSEQYRSLRSRIERLSPGNELQVLAITSAAKAEGKSLTAVNLSVVLAQNSRREVLLIDADFRRPQAEKLLGMPSAPGLAELLHGEASPDETIRRTPFFGLSVVPAGNAKDHPAELLASPEFAEFLVSCRSRYDHVLLDTPPVHPISDVNFLVEAVDGVLLVVRAGKTRKELLKRAVETIPQAKLVGTVLNGADDLGHGYGYGYNYAYGTY